MALVNVDQQSNLKHLCKICKKSFGCGRALGGHMRAHGLGDQSWHLDDDDDEDDNDELIMSDDSNDKIGSGGENMAPPTTNKRMYALRTNPNRLKSCRACKNCGKEFLSWKSFLEHGKCTFEDVESPISSPRFDEEDDDDDGVGWRGCGWSKRKRSFRSAKVGNFHYSNNYSPSSEEEDLANCLMMLSNAAAAEPEESCASASRDEEIQRNPINFIAPISTYRVPMGVVDHKAKGHHVAPKPLFECKACKKVFNSHQALGGHRASHKKVKGCFALRLDRLGGAAVGDDDVITHEEVLPTKSNSTLQYNKNNNNNNNNNVALLMGLSSSSKKKSKVHECSICHRTFSSGQALGGHKRCHWITPNVPDNSALAKFQQFHIPPKFDNSESSSLDLKLDLNFPAPANNISGRREIYLLESLVGRTKDKDDDTNNIYNGRQHHHEHYYHQETKNDKEEEKNNNNNNNNSINISMQNVAEDEADSKVKLAKLSELKDMNVGEGSSPWLQVGISSMTIGVGADP